MNRIQPDTSLPKENKIKLYTALLNQFSTNIPVAIIQQNTMGETPTYTRLGAGTYLATFQSLQFQIDKTYCTTSAIQNGIVSAYVNDEESIVIYSQDITGSYADDILNLSPIEIRLYV